MEIKEHLFIDDIATAFAFGYLKRMKDNKEPVFEEMIEVINNKAEVHAEGRLDLHERMQKASDEFHELLKTHSADEVSAILKERNKQRRLDYIKRNIQ